MAVDLTGGLDPAREFVFAEQPDDPEMRESVNIWLWDDSADFGMPRVGIEAVADQWDTHDLQVNIALADGTLLPPHAASGSEREGGPVLLGVFEPGAVHDPIGADGRARVLGAGGLRFELVEPFVHWRMDLEATARSTTFEAMAAGRRPETSERVPVGIHIDIRSAVPPWENGGLRAEAARIMAEQEEGILIGGPRFEQLFRATGTFTVGAREFPLNGGGLRIRRAGVRRTARFWGHAWQSAVFPSGRAFGYLTYPPRDDGLPTYNEGFLFQGDGELIPARVVDAPWLRRLQQSGQAVPLTLETDAGEQVRIEGETLLSAVHAIPVDEGEFPVLHQAIVRYRWDGESANGMLERSMPPEGMDPTQPT